MSRNSAIAGVVCAVCLLSSCLSKEHAKQRAFERGKQFYAQGKYEDAALQFRKAIQSDTAFGQAYYQLGLTDLKRNDNTGAYKALSDAVSLLPGQDGPKIAFANICLDGYLAAPERNASQYAVARRIADELYAKDPTSFAALRLEGYLAVADGQPRKAAEYFEKAMERKPGAADVVAQLTQNLLRSGDTEQGIALGRKFLTSHPSYGPMYDILYAHYLATNQKALAESLLLEKIANNPAVSLFRIELAQHYSREGDHAKMAQALEAMLAKPKDFPDADLDAGDFYAGLHDWPAARTLYEKGLASDKARQLTYQKRLVTVFLSEGNRQSAQHTLEEILKQDHNDREARASQAALWVASGDRDKLDAAIHQFKQLVHEQPDNQDLRFQLASCEHRAGETQAAERDYKIIVQRNPEHVPSLQALAEINVQSLKLDEARRYAAEVLKRDPHNPSARLVQSAVLASNGEYANTRAALERLIRDYPQLGAAHLQMALLDVQQKRYAEAEGLFRKYYQPGSADYRVLRGLIELYRSEGAFDKALSTLQAEQKEHPQSDEIRSLLAATAAETGKYDLAVENYRAIAQAHPQSSEIRMRLGGVYSRMGNTAAALAEYRGAANLDPHSAVTQAFYARALDEAGRKPEAAAAYRTSLGLQGNNPWVMNNLAYLMTETGGNLNEALMLAQNAAQRVPKELAFQDTVGWVLLKRKDTANASRIFRTLCEQQPGNASYHFHLALALIESGQAQNARSELLSAMKRNPSPSDAVSIQETLKSL